MLNVNNSANADATVTDAPHNQGVLIINKHNKVDLALNLIIH